ncbi:MAG: hypothetical protein ABIQ44_08770 [Chloroflexia bacterium]
MNWASHATWYRGVYSVEAGEEGSLVTYSVHNVAPGVGRWAAQLVQGPQHARTIKDDLSKLLKAIGARLGCAVEVAGNDWCIEAVE